jgi:hypothetical protein
MLNQLKEKIYALFQKMQNTVVVKPSEPLSDRINDTRMSGARRKTLDNPTSAEEKLRKPGVINATITCTRLQALKGIPPVPERNVNERFVLSDHLDKVTEGPKPNPTNSGTFDTKAF